MGLDKKWEVHDISSVHLQRNEDVTKSLDTFLHFFIILWATLFIAPLRCENLYFFMAYLVSLVVLLLLSWMMLKDAFLQELFHLNAIIVISLILLGTFFLLPLKDSIKIILIALLSLYSFLQLLFNRNFILYDLLYRFRLKIKLITIEENLSPFSPLITQFERIILGLNKNTTSLKDFDLQEGTIFFWIRKDKQKSKERSISEFIPFLSLITILFVLKEKSYKFVAIVGTYFSLVGIMFISFHTYLLEKLRILHILNDNTTIAVITIFFLVLWYLLTIYNIYGLIDMSKYIKQVNAIARRARIKKDFNFAKGFGAILETFERDNAVYIYDCLFDKYLHVNAAFLSQNLNMSRRLVDRNIAVLITVVISMVLAVFVEITANGVFQYIQK